jgi:hypothetical protein
MTEEVKSYDYEFAYVIDGVVVAVSHVDEFFHNILINPSLQIIHTTEYGGDVIMGYNYDGEFFSVPEDFVMPGETVPDPTVVSEPPL